MAEPKTIAYLKLKDIGEYALTPPIISRRFRIAKKFLIKMEPQAVERHLKELKEASIRCVETRTGARFCLISYDRTELEAMEMCRATFKFKHIIEKREEPSIQECRAAGKNDFLVVEEKTL